MHANEVQDDTDWIDTHKAVSAVANIEPGRFDKRWDRAAERLMELAKEHMLRVRAVKRVDRTYGVSTAELRRRTRAGDLIEPEEQVKWETLVPKSAWKDVLSPDHVLEQFKWQTGNFDGGGQDGLGRHIEMKLVGMEFAVRDLRRALPSVDWDTALFGPARLRQRTAEAANPAPLPSSDSPTSPAKKTRDRPPTAEWWPQFIADLALFVADRGLPPSKDKLWEEVCARMQERVGFEAARTTAQPAIDALYEAHAHYDRKDRQG